jgi:hypothetical protein
VTELSALRADLPTVQPLLEPIADTGALSPDFASYSTHVE